MFGIFVVLPLSLLKDLSKLAYTSGISVLADVFLTLIVLFAGAGEARYIYELRLSRLKVLVFVHQCRSRMLDAVKIARHR